MAIIDWRNGLEWVPILVFFLLIFIPTIIGAFSGWRRAIFWGGGILVMYCIGWILAAFLAESLTVGFYKYILNLLHINITDLPDDLIIKVGVPFARMFFFIICTLIGTLIIVLPSYFIWGKRALKIGKYSISKEKRAELNYQALINGVSKRKLFAEYKYESKEQTKLTKGMGIGTHLAGLVILGATFFPICTSTTELTYAATCRYTKDTSFSSNLSTFCETINRYSSYNYVDNTYTNLSCYIAFTQLATMLDNDGNNLLNTFMQILSKGFNNIKILFAETQKITVATMNSIKLQITSFSDYISTQFTGSDKTYADAMSSYINEMANSTYYTNLFVEFICSQYMHANVTLDQFLIINSLMNVIKNNSTINVFTDNTNLQLTDYTFDDWIWSKLKLNNKGYQLFFRSVVKNLNFDIASFQQDDLESATNLMSEFFAENIDAGPSLKPITSINDVVPLINYDKWLAVNNDFPNFEQAKQMLLDANGTEEHPYIIPTDMYWKASGSATVLKNNEFLADGQLFHWNLFPSFTPIDAKHIFSLTVNQNPGTVSGLKIQINSNEKLISFGHSDTTPSFDIFDNPQVFSFNISCTDSISELAYTTTKYFVFRSFINI